MMNSRPYGSEMDIHELLRLTVEKTASDLHLRAGAPQILRVHGALISIGDGQAILAPEDTERAFAEVVSEPLREDFSTLNELDFAYAVPDLGRFRVNASVQRGSIALAFRRIGLAIPSLDELNLPPICKS